MSITFNYSNEPVKPDRAVFFQTGLTLCSVWEDGSVATWSTVCFLNAKMNVEKKGRAGNILQVPRVSKESELLAAEEILSNNKKKRQRRAGGFKIKKV